MKRYTVEDAEALEVRVKDLEHILSLAAQTAREKLELEARVRELSSKLTQLTLLAAQADLCTPTERAVLDAMAAMDREWLERTTGFPWNTIATAELARREAK